MALYNANADEDMSELETVALTRTDGLVVMCLQNHLLDADSPSPLAYSKGKLSPPRT